MKNSDFRTPLLQSGVLLFVFLLFFSFVTSSGADGFGSGLLAIISGIFHSIVFAIGLIFSILLSIVLLVVLFLAAVALYSLDKAKDLWSQLQSTLLNFFSAMSDSLVFMKTRSLEYFLLTNQQESRIWRKRYSILLNKTSSLQLTINSLEKRIEELQSMQSKGGDAGLNSKQQVIARSLINDAADCFGYFLSAKMHPEAPFQICLPGIQENIPLR